MQGERERSGEERIVRRGVRAAAYVVAELGGELQLVLWRGRICTRIQKL